MKFNFPLLLLTFYIAYCSASEDCNPNNIFKDKYNDVCQCSTEKTTTEVWRDGAISKHTQKTKTMCLEGEFCDRTEGCVSRLKINKCKNNDGTVPNYDECRCVDPNTKDFRRCDGYAKFCDNGNVYHDSKDERKIKEDEERIREAIVNTRRDNKECRIRLGNKSYCQNSSDTPYTPCKCYKNDADSITNTLEASNNYEDCTENKLCIKGHGARPYCHGRETDCYCVAEDARNDAEGFCVPGKYCDDGVCR
jgi:hypothetical protein